MNLKKKLSEKYLKYLRNRIMKRTNAFFPKIQLPTKVCECDGK